MIIADLLLMGNILSGQNYFPRNFVTLQRNNIIW